jgi:diamine N-acetyltransferase
MSTNSPLITLREISAETVRAIIELEVAEDQQNFVASNAVSLAQALFSPEAWYRAIYRGDEPVGFVMLYDEALRPVPPAHPAVGVWRLMVDRRFQGQGIGKAALLQVIEHVRAKGLYSKLNLSYVPGPGCPELFYRQLGFQPNGQVEDGEVVLELPLAASAT